MFKIKKIPVAMIVLIKKGSITLSRESISKQNNMLTKKIRQQINVKNIILLPFNAYFIYYYNNLKISFSILFAVYSFSYKSLLLLLNWGRTFKFEYR